MQVRDAWSSSQDRGSLGVLMAIYIGATRHEPHQQTLVNKHDGRTITFDMPADLVYYLDTHEDFKLDVRAGFWLWVH